MRSPMFAGVNVPANYRAQPPRSADGPHPKLRSPRSFLGLFHSCDLAADDLLPSAFNDPDKAGIVDDQALCQCHTSQLGRLGHKPPLLGWTPPGRGCAWIR